MVMVPVRVLVVLLALKRYPTLPLPAPSAPEVIVNHSALLRAVHLHASCVETTTLAVPESADSVRRSWSIVMLHGAASCITRTRSSLTTISPSRVAGAALAAATNSTLPLPCPDAGDRFEIQLACVETVQAHSGGAVTETADVPPPAATICWGPASVSWHFAGVGPVVTADVFED
jgi:hypothetical protein